MKRLVLPGVLFALAACNAPDTIAPVASPRGDLVAAVEETPMDAELQASIDGINDRLAAEGASIRISKAEWFGVLAENAAGGEVLAKNVGNRRLEADFVPNDARRFGWSGVPSGDTDDIRWAVDGSGDAVPFFGGMSAARTTAAITRAMATWDGAACSNLAMTRNATGTLDLGWVAASLSGGAVGSFAVAGDVQHAGWRDLNFPTGVLAVTYTINFIDPATGEETDVNGDGRGDVAFREIYYDPNYSWADNGIGLDTETIALHEVGHGLSQQHFGKITLREDGTLKLSPLAVMNAGYTQVQRELTGTDSGGHCGNWGSWPQN